MIEFELKYKLTKIPEELHGFEIIKTQRQSDVYYDTQNYSLIKNGNFLRIRDDLRMDFKIDLNDVTHLYCKETSFKIAELAQKTHEVNQVLIAIGFSSVTEFTTLDDFIVKNDFVELARIEKARTVYKFGDDCKICIDDVQNLGLFLEAEIMIKKDILSQEEATAIKDALIKRLHDAKIIDETVETFNTGYVELYLLVHNPKAYELGKFKL